uniref:Transcription factor TGA7 family protein n=1 Tax=Rhizophora mucronata TaxID=61149 RepID=A0A2P2LQU2_RHIMU
MEDDTEESRTLFFEIVQLKAQRPRKNISAEEQTMASIQVNDIPRPSSPNKKNH